MKYSNILLITALIAGYENSLCASDANMISDLAGLSNLITRGSLENQCKIELAQAYKLEEQGQYCEAVKIYHKYMKNKKLPMIYRTGTASRIGFLYMEGRAEFPKNYAQAIVFLDWAMADKKNEAPNAEAMYNRGCMYVHGWGGNGPDIDKAIECFEKAVQYGEDYAYYSLGLQYMKKERFEDAHLAFKESWKKNGNLVANHNRICLFIEDHGSLDQTKENVTRALIENAGQGCIESIFTLAMLQLDEYTVLEIPKNPEQGELMLQSLINVPNKRIALLAITMLLRFLSIADSEKKMEMEEGKEVKNEKLDRDIELKKESQIQSELRDNTVVVLKEEKKEIKVDHRIISVKDQLKSLFNKKKSSISSELEAEFDQKEINILEDFAQSREKINWRDMKKIFGVLTSVGVIIENTKNGYKLQKENDITSLHKGHGNDAQTVDPGAATNIREFIRETVLK